MKRIIQTKNAPAPIGPYSQAVVHGSILYLSGQIAIDPENGELNTSDIHVETSQVMNNIEAVLERAGTDFTHVIKSTIFLKNMDDFPVVNEIYGSRFSGDYPARETVAVRTLPKNVNVEISMIVALD